MTLIVLVRGSLVPRPTPDLSMLHAEREERVRVRVWVRFRVGLGTRLSAGTIYLCSYRCY